MAYADRYDAAFGIFVARYLRNNVHTNIRAKVTAVDISGPYVTVQPMAYTEFPSGTVDKYPPLFNVPLQLPSGSGGKARLSMPVKPGDVVGVSFSERNEDDNTDEQTHGMFSGWAVTEIFTEGNARPIDPDNVVLENDKSIITLKPTGDTTFVNPKVTIQSLADGTFSINNGSGSVQVAPSGEITANGAKITPAGRIITANGVDLDDFYQAYLQHRHGGVETGSGTTGTPQ